jgi:hypothetical protein
MPRLDLPALEAAFQLIRSRKFAPLMPNGSTITGRSQDRPSVFPCWSAIGLLDKFGASKEIRVPAALPHESGIAVAFLENTAERLYCLLASLT